jgi:hypothetical protein
MFDARFWEGDTYFIGWHGPVSNTFYWEVFTADRKPLVLAGLEEPVADGWVTGVPFYEGLATCWARVADALAAHDLPAA